MRIKFRSNVPGRGLSLLLLGGLLLARALTEGGEHNLDQQRLLELATEMEGHPDNVAPAIMGGFVVSGQSPDSVWATAAQLSTSVEIGRASCRERV